MSKAQKPQQKPNKASEKAGLTLNVTAIKKSIKNYYRSQSIDYSKVSGGNIAMASMLESMVKLIICKCEKEVALSKSGLKEVTREGMNSALLRNSGEYGYFIVKANDFNDKFDYSKFLPIDKELEKIYLEHQVVSFSIEAKNYMCYLLYTMFTNIAVTCAKLLSFAKNKTVNGNCVVHAVEIEFPKSIAIVLTKNINEALRLHGQNLEGKGDDESDSGEEQTETGDAVETEVSEEPDNKKKTQTKPKTETKVVEKTEAKTETKTKPKTETKVVETKQPPKANTTSTTNNKKGGNNKKKPIEVEDDADEQDEIQNADEDEQDEQDEPVEEPKPSKKDSKKPVTNQTKSKK